MTKLSFLLYLLLLFNEHGREIPGRDDFKMFRLSIPIHRGIFITSCV